VTGSHFLVLPKRPEAAAAGTSTPEPPSPIASEYIAFQHEWLHSVFRIEPENLTMEVAAGQSMQPTIHDGDLLLIDTTDRGFRNFGIYVLEIAGVRVVKRVQAKFDGSLILISDNTSYQVDVVPPARTGEVTVIGRVVWSGGML
jgi:phage repressor protein C with HTH and peptisase S24 domain